MSDRLVVVSNRLPLTAKPAAGRWTTEQSSGGLIAALEPVMDRMGGLWIGSPGESAGSDSEGRREVIEALERDRGFVAVDLPPRVARAFYEGFSNGTLWPLFHGLTSRATFDPETWQAYREANQRFADVVAKHVRPGDLVWVHDYQLLLLPAMLRRARPEIRIGFFLHIPFPASDIFRILPEREAILQGMLGADLLAFQTHEHMGAFRRSLLQVLGLDSRIDGVDADGRPVRLDAMPIGIVPGRWEELAGRDPRVAARVRELHARHHDRRLILAVDRLDYTKGIPERLRAFRRLLVKRPEWRGRVSLIQVAVPSREGVRRYAELRTEVSEMIGELNGDFGTPAWTPAIYMRRSITTQELASLYAAADVAWVAPLRDGMNLVAKEFVASQLDGAGVLVISEFAGAASELGEAIRVNPYDESRSADAIHRALTLPEPERRERQAALLARVRRDNAFAWSEQFIDRLVGAAGDRQAAGAAVAEPPLARLREGFSTARHRTLFIDYDGSLVPLVPRPEDAAPAANVRDVVAALALQPGTTVVLASGRTQADLDRWWSDVPRLWLAAEHGALIREPGGLGWHPLRTGASADWKASVAPVLAHFAARAPGSFIEEKAFSLAWHYRLSDPEFGEWLATELASTLDHQLAGTELTVLRGSKVIEVRFAWANKGELATRILGSRPQSFVLALGDDRTDEELFERLPAEAWTIRVGPGPTRARYRLASPAATIDLLRALGRARIRRA